MARVHQNFETFDKFATEVRRLWAMLREEGRFQEPHPPVSERPLAAFERRFGIALPEDYRQFLLQLGNGGAWLNALLDYDRSGDFGKPFPHRRAWNYTARQFARMPDEGIDDEGYAAFWRDYFRTELIDGAIPVCHGGCSRLYLLVVAGPEQGQVWIDERGSEAGIYPTLNASHRRLQFSQWYLA